MKLWKQELTIDKLNEANHGTIHNAIGIRFTAIGDDYLEATLPVDERTRQPAGILHGGASVVLAESLGSFASYLLTLEEGKVCVGIEINASHLKGVREGHVFGRVRPIRLGQSLHVWEIRIRESEDLQSDLVCLSRLTVMVRNKSKSKQP